MIPATDLAAFTLAECERLVALAPRAIASGKSNRDAAEQRCRAWLAMACLMGADHPVIAEFLDPGDVIFQRGTPWDEGQRRVVAAQEICPKWRDELARALIAAGNSLTTPENVTRWVNLAQLAAALGVTPTARQPERTAA